MVIIKINFQITAIGYFDGIGNCFRVSLEALPHFTGRFEIKGIGGKAEMFGVSYSFSGLDAEQDFMGMRVFPVQVVTIVGSNEFNTKL